MNASLIAAGGLNTLVQAPAWSILMLKLTAILSIAWSAYFILKQVNPRWRILLWRVTASGLILLFVATWMFPSWKLRVLQPPLVEETVAMTSDMARKVEKEATVSDTLHTPWALQGNMVPDRFGLPGDMPGPLENGSASDMLAKPSDMAKLSESAPLAAALPVSETPGPAPSIFLTWPVVLVTGWLVGIVLLGLRLLLGHLRIAALVRRAKPAAPWIVEESLRVSQAIGSPRPVEVLQSSEVVSPFLFGIRRPQLLLPEKMRLISYRNDIPGILAHELTHVRHNDIAWNILLQLLSIVLWFHPMVWRMRKAHLASCELVSDAASAEFVGNVSDYCRTLARVAVDACGALPSTGMAMARTSAIIHRLNVLRKQVFHNPLRRRSVVGFGLITLLSAAMLGVLQLAFAEPSVNKTSDKVVAASSGKTKTIPEPKTPRVRIETMLVTVRRDSELAKKIAMGHPVLEETKCKELVDEALKDKQGQVLAEPVLITDLGQGAGFGVGKDAPVLCCTIVPTAGTEKGTLNVEIKPHLDDEANKESTKGRQPRIRLDAEVKPDEAVVFGGWEEIFRKPSNKDYVTFLVVQAASCDEKDEAAKPAPQAKPSAAKPSTPAATLKKTAAPAKDTIRVHVLDEAGKPLEGVKIHAKILMEGNRRDRKNYTTDAAGIAEVKLLKSYCDVDLWISKKGFVKLLSTWKANALALGEKLPAEHTVHMIRTVPAGGQVLDPQGNPIAGVKVQVTIEGGKPPEKDKHTMYDYWLATEQKAATTDAEGRWHIDTFPDDDSVHPKVITYHPDYVSDRYWNQRPEGDQPSVEALRKEIATMTIRHGIVASGNVTDNEGKPIEGAVVIQGEDSYTAFTPCRFLTDADGHYCLAALPPQNTVLMAVAPGFQIQLRRVEIREGMPPQDFQLAPAKPMRVRFVDTEGKPIPEVELFMTEWKNYRVHLSMTTDDPKEPKIEIPKKTDADGLWTWKTAPAEPVKFNISKKGFAPCEREITSDDSLQTITLKPEHRITGRVTDAASGKPIPEFTLVPINVFQNRNPAADWLCAQKQTDGQISYLVTRTDIPLRLQIHAMGYRSQTGPEFRVGDETNRTQDFQLQKSKPISGTLLDIAGKPSPKTEVMLSTPTNHVGIEPVWETYKITTDAKGHFTFPNPGEPFTIVVQVDKGFVTKTFPVDKLDVGSIQLEPWATVDVLFTDDGKPIPNATISLTTELIRDPLQPSIRTSLHAVSDAEGRCTFTRVPPMTLHVGAWHPLYHSDPNVSVTLKPGQHETVKLGVEGKEKTKE